MNGTPEPATGMSPAPDTAAAPESTTPPGQERRLVAGVALASMLAPLNSTMIAVALVSIEAHMHVSVATAAWLVTGYLILMASTQPTAGRLGDRFQRRPLLLGGLALFLAVSLGAALSPTFSWLLGFRLLQAVAASVALPNGSALLRTLVPAARRGRTFGLVGGATSLAAASGPPLAGLLVWLGGWQSIFFVNVLVVVPAWLLIRAALPAASPRTARTPAAPAALALTGGEAAGTAESATSPAEVGAEIEAPTPARPTPPSRARHQTASFDVAGAVWLCAVLAGIASFLILNHGYSFLQAGEGAALAVAAAGFVLYEWRRAAPVLQPRFFLRKAFSAACASVALGNFTMYVTLLAIPMLLAARSGWTEAHIGLVLSAMSGCSLVFAPLGGMLADRFGRRTPALVGMVCATAGAVTLLLAGAGAGTATLLAGLGVMGAGMGLSGSGLRTAAAESAAAEEAGLAMGMFSTSRYLGSIVGSSLLAHLLEGRVAGTSAYHTVFAAITVTAVLAVFTTVGIPGRFRTGVRPETHAAAGG